MYYRLELWYDWSDNAKNGKYDLNWGCASSTVQSGGTWTDATSKKADGKKTIEITDTSSPQLDIVVYDVSPASQAATGIVTLTLGFQPVAPTTGDIFGNDADEQTLANGADASKFVAYSDLNVVTDNGNKPAKAAWTFNGGFENLQNGSWTFTGSLVTSQGATQRTFTFDPEIDINM